MQIENRHSSGKITYLTGLKGVACLIVALNHFGGAFFPAGTLMEKVCFPLQIFFNGTFMVQVFFLISGFLVGYSFFTKHDMAKLEKSVVLRWFRLTLPVAAVCAIIWLVMKTGAYSAYDQMRQITGSVRKESDALNYYMQRSFAQLVVTSLTFLIRSATEFTFVLWMMHDLFIGFFIAVILTLMLDRLSPVFAIAAACASLLFLKQFVWTFAIGPLLAYIYVKYPLVLRKRVILLSGVFAALGAFYIGNWPLTGGSRLVMYSPLERVAYLLSVNYVPIYAGGAVLTLWAFLTLKPLQKLFSVKPMRVLGDCSFAVYLLHDMIEVALGANVFMLLYRHVTQTVWVVTLITGVVAVAVTIVAAYVFHCTVEKYSLRLCEWGYRVMTEPLKAQLAALLRKDAPEAGEAES